ncbi:MAG: hypothetical protein IKE91_01005 [Clostridia bacterium]|nr:hypothetical protein [Clostridia bacterium]
MNRKKIKVPFYLIIIALSLICAIRLYIARTKAYDTTYAVYGPEYEETASTVCRVYGPFEVIDPDTSDHINIPYKYYDSIEDACNDTGTVSNKTIELTQLSVEINSTITLPNGTNITTSSDLLQSGDTATITRGSGCTGTMISITNYFNDISDIKIDGGWGSNHTGTTASGPVISSTTELNMENVEIENNYNTSVDGGGAIIANGALNLTGVTINNCASTYAGAIKSTNVINCHSATVTNCYSTNSTGITTSAIYVDANDYGLRIDNITVTGCAAVNATTGGETIYSSECIDIGSAVLTGGNINISNNYSAGDVSGVLQASGQSSYVRIYEDSTITGNKNGCTFDNSWTVTSTGNNSNLNIVNPTTTYINYVPTSSANVGISVIGEDMSGDNVEFAITSIITSAEVPIDGFVSDYDGSSITGNNGRAYINYAPYVPPGPGEDITIYIKILQNEKSGVSHNYEVAANWISQGTNTLSGVADDLNCITVPITVAPNAQGTISIILDGYYNPNITYCDLQLVTADTGFSSPTTQGGGIPYNAQITYDASLMQDGATIKVRYNFIDGDTPPDTGINEGVKYIIWFICIIIVFGIIIIKIK